MVEIDYWTMSPHDFSASGSAGIFTVWSMAKIMGVNDTDDHLGVRPVINVKADVQITGTGSQTDPFKVATS